MPGKAEQRAEKDDLEDRIGPAQELDQRVMGGIAAECCQAEQSTCDTLWNDPAAQPSDSASAGVIWRCIFSARAKPKTKRSGPVDSVVTRRKPARS